MSDIFLSYARKDAERAAMLAAALQAQGWTVFLDETITPGKDWLDVITSQLKLARCVVVAWSTVSIERHYVREEASFGLERGVLVPLLLDTVEPPFGFRLIQAADLRNWAGDADAATFRLLVEAVAEKIGQPARPLAGKTRTTNPKPTHPKPYSIIRHPLRNTSLGPEMVVIPAGEFHMGDLDGSGLAHEKPVHRVHIAQPFYLGRYAVSFEEYDLFALAKGIEPPSDENNWGRGKRPVINVSWEDAVAYCQWLSRQTGQPYRLPSEAEWEYAARAGTKTTYWWGNEAGQNRANFEGSGCRWSNKKTASSGSFEPNPWGLHDMAGNVWEWVRDRWHESYQYAPADGSAWEDGESTRRVLRGGAWNFNADRVQSSSRLRSGPDKRLNYFGFRVALSQSDPV